MSTPTKKPSTISQLTEAQKTLVGTMHSPLLGPWVEPFLEMLGKVGIVSVACKHANIDRTTAYNLRDADPHFATRWREAIETSVDILEATARQRAANGTKMPVVNKGKVVTDKDGNTIYQVKNSDALMIFLLKKYRYPDQVIHTGPNGGPIKVEHKLVPENKEKVITGVARLVEKKALPAPSEVIDIESTIMETGGRDADERLAMKEAGDEDADD